MSDYLGFVCHTCRKRTAPLGERMNRQWWTAKEAVRLRILIRDACRAVRRIEAEKTPWTIQVHFGISYSGGPKPDLHFPEFDAWFEAHAEHDMEACGEWEYTPHDSDPTHGVYEDE